MNAAPRFVIAALIAGASLPVFADSFDCFPSCPEPRTPSAASQPVVDPCANGLVQAATQADEKMQPVKRVYGAVTNPVGFAFNEINARALHLPTWTGYVLDPQGAVRAKLLERAREEAKKRLGLDARCAAIMEQADDTPFLESGYFEEIPPAL